MRSSALAVACLLLVPAGAQAGTRDDPPIASQQQLVILLANKSVHARPGNAGRLLLVIADRRPITLARTALPVLAQTTDAGGQAWLRVRLPGRVLKRAAPPRTGWISASNTQPASTAWHIVVDVGARQVRVYREGHRLRGFMAIVGKPSTPTPRGEYFVEESLRLSARQTGAPFALASSARSTVLQEFAGGPGQIALHGRDNIGGRPGTAVSHGCVRLTSRAIAWLAARIRPGVPLTIV